MNAALYAMLSIAPPSDGGVLVDIQTNVECNGTMTTIQPTPGVNVHTHL